MSAAPMFPRARTSDPATSHEAAAAIESSGLAAMQLDRTADAVTRHPGHTTAELAQLIAATTGEDEGTVRHWLGRRMSEAARLGRIVGAGRRTCAVTGRTATLWAPVARKSMGQR